jgi:hypothetical protein
MIDLLKKNNINQVLLNSLLDENHLFQIVLNEPISSYSNSWNFVKRFSFQMQNMIKNE